MKIVRCAPEVRCVCVCLPDIPRPGYHMREKGKERKKNSYKIVLFGVCAI